MSENQADADERGRGRQVLIAAVTRLGDAQRRALPPDGERLRRGRLSTTGRAEEPEATCAQELPF